MRRNGGGRPPELEMAPIAFAVLHGGAGLEITLLEYLYRVLLYLFAFGGVAAIVFWGLGTARAIHSRVIEDWDREENEL